MKLTLPTVALVVIQISCIYSVAGHRVGHFRNTGRSRDVHRGTKRNVDKHANGMKTFSSSNDLVFKSQGLKAKSILLSFSMDSSLPNRVERSLRSGQKESKTSAVKKKVKKSQQSRGRKSRRNRIKAPFKALRKKVSLNRSQDQKNVRKSQQRTGRKPSRNRTKAPFNALRKKVSLNRSQNQRKRDKRGFKIRI